MSRKIPSTITQGRELLAVCHLFATILRHHCVIAPGPIPRRTVEWRHPQASGRTKGKRLMSDTTSNDTLRPSPRIIDVIAYMALTFGIGIAVSMVLAGAVLFLNHAPV